MRTAEEIIKSKYPFYDEKIAQKDVELCGEQVSMLINEARIEAIKEASEVADVKDVGSCNSNGEWEELYEVDKQSILNLLNNIQ